jgi:hypothetical protein
MQDDESTNLDSPQPSDTTDSYATDAESSVQTLLSDETFNFVPTLQEEDAMSGTTAGATTGPPTGATAATATPGTPPSTVVINGVTYQRRSAPKTILVKACQVLYKKADRENLPTDERVALFEKATKLAHKKYEIMPLSLEDEDKLDDTYNLDILIKKTKRSHFTYDMHDVFTIVYPKDAPNEEEIESEKDLYTQYPDITIEDVARSNLWYRTWMDPDFFEQNLSLTHDFFANNVEDNLWMKVAENYDTFDHGEQGGPLFFIIMLNHLLSDTEEAAASLVKKVKTFEIRKVTGEDIYKVVSLLRGAINRLTYIHKLPDDITKLLLIVFQSTSVPDFNATFQLLDKQRKQQAVLRRTGGVSTLEPQDIFTLAESEYRDMLLANTWSGVNTKGSSAFHADGSGPPGGNRFELTCFNCGEKHHLKHCRKPRDEARINLKAQEFAAMMKKKRGDRNGSTPPGRSKNTKFAPPQPNENNKRSIDGKPMFWMSGRKRWIPDRDGAKQANVAGKKKKKVPSEAVDTDAHEDTDEPSSKTKSSLANHLQLANSIKALQAKFSALNMDGVDGY